jgi:hypothetical protein
MKENNYILQITAQQTKALHEAIKVSRKIFTAASTDSRLTEEELVNVKAFLKDIGPVKTKIDGLLELMK